MRRKAYICALLGALALALTPLAGCVDAPAPQGGREPLPEGRPVTVRLNLAVGIAGTQGTPTRAGEETTTPGTEQESAVHRLTLFFADLDKSGNEATTARHETFEVEWNGSEAFSKEIEMEATTGRKHIYVGANLTERQIESFASQVQGAYTAATGTAYDHYKEMMAEFIQTGGFTMFGRATQNARPEVTFPDRPGAKIDISVALSRVVAKVLVTVEADEERTQNGIRYAKIASREGHEDGPDEKSWIRLDDMHFLPNITNRRLFMHQKRDDTGRIVDPNHRFEDLIELEEGDFHYKGDDQSREFVRWLPNIWNADDIEEWGMRVAVHDEGRMPHNGPAPEKVYREGLYCLENTVGPVPADWEAVLEGNREAVTYMATTYVLVAAKTTPRWIITKEQVDTASNPARPIPRRAESEEEAWELLIETPAGEEEAHPAGTFYSPDRESFYSYDGMMARIERDEVRPETDPDKLTRENFLCYPEGWGYYATYMDGAPEGNRLLFDSERSSVLRNNYYILHVKQLGAPPLPGEGSVNEMEITVRRYGWRDAGEGDLVLKP